MGKKNKKKQKKLLKMWKMDSKSIEILESGKIKFKKDEKIDIRSFIDNSVNDAIISRLEGIPSREEIVIDGGSEYRIDASANCSNITRILELVSSINTTDVQTIVIPMTKKKASNLDSNVFIDWLAKSSTFTAAYAKLKKSWDELNEDDNTSFTNVLYIPKIYIFMEKKGKLRKKPIMINVMIVALPPMSKAKSGIEETDVIEYTNRIINDSLEATIRCGCTSVIIDPFCMNSLKKDVHYTSRYWHGKTESQRVIENIRHLTFSIDNDELYIIFCKNK